MSLSLRRRFRRKRNLLLFLFTVVSTLVLESLLHTRRGNFARPTSRASDAPFQRGCSVPKASAPRANATILMLARNSDAQEAAATLRNLEETFNRWFSYPITFLNDEPWSEEFKAVLSSNVTSGKLEFVQIPKGLWGFPPNFDVEGARKSFKAQANKGILYAGMESYHHMCRFYSGAFYDVPALDKYKWYWRVEPGVKYTCQLTYDPFMAMQKSGKRYGYTIALWERGDTAPSLFRAVDAYAREKGLHSWIGDRGKTSVWKAMVEASWAPWPIRKFIIPLVDPHRDHTGDRWSMCHYWSNFEIGDLDWFRGKEYRDFMTRLEELGGFYTERWGDAPVHSFAAALLLQPHEIHLFDDLGYQHDPFWVQPFNAEGGQLPKEDLGVSSWAPEKPDGIGCRCTRRAAKTRNAGAYCYKRLAMAIRESAWNWEE